MITDMLSKVNPSTGIIVHKEGFDAFTVSRLVEEGVIEPYRVFRGIITSSVLTEKGWKVYKDRYGSND